MGKMLGEEDPKPAKMEKKLKKSKQDKTIDLLDVNRASVIDSGKRYVEVDGGLPKEKVQRERSRKRKSTSNEDWNEGEHENGSLERDGDLQEKDKKKRKRFLSDDNRPTEKAQRELKEQGPDDGPDAERDSDPKPWKEKKKKKKKKKKKHEPLEKKREEGSAVSSCGITESEKMMNDEVVEGNNFSGKFATEMQSGGECGDKKTTNRGKKNSNTEGIEVSMQNPKGQKFNEVDKKRKRDSAEDKHPLSEKVRIDDKESDLVDGPDPERDSDPKPRKEKKRKKRRHEGPEKDHRKDGDISSIGISNGEKTINSEVVEVKNSSSKYATDMKKGEEGTNKKKINRGEKNNGGKGIKIFKNSEGGNSDKASDAVRGTVAEESDKGVSTPQDEGLVDSGSNNGLWDETLSNEDYENSEGKKKKNTSNEDGENSKGKKKKITMSFENNSDKPEAKVRSKRVCFSSHVEVFPSSDIDNEQPKTPEDDLVQGKRFTKEEDEIIKEAIFNYIKIHNLGESGVEKVMNSRSNGLKGCWKEIATCIPYRPQSAIYYRAHILFERSEERKWTQEELEALLEFVKRHGKKWKMAAQEFGKSRVHVKDAYRRIKLQEVKKGRWTQEEYQTLYDLVNLDLQMKVSQDKKSKHGMLRDNIPWEAISDKMATRRFTSSCDKWYNQLTSSLVDEKKWACADDYRLIGALYDLDAACVDDVDWDNLLKHRSGDVCRKRWDQMVLHIGHRGSKPFAEQVEILAKRYCPALAETREAWDSKPIVP